jgi:hypothetical protein
MKGRVVDEAFMPLESGYARGEDDVLLVVVWGVDEQSLEGSKGLALHDSLIGAGGSKVHHKVRGRLPLAG